MIFYVGCKADTWSGLQNGKSTRIANDDIGGRGYIYRNNISKPLITGLHHL